MEVAWVDELVGCKLRRPHGHGPKLGHKKFYIVLAYSSRPIQTGSTAGKSNEKKNEQ